MSKTVQNKKVLNKFSNTFEHSFEQPKKYGY